MKTKLLAILFTAFGISCFGHNDIEVVNSFSNYFDEAYSQHPEIPRGLLEAVAFNNTHFNQITHSPAEEESCIGMPQAYGVMGLILDGKNYFNNNLQTVSIYSGYSVNEIISSPEKNILAYASAFSSLLNNESEKNWKTYSKILIQLSALPNGGTLSKKTENIFPEQQFALNTELYGYLAFLINPKNSALYNFPAYAIDLQEIFGENNLKILSAPKINISTNNISDDNGNSFRIGNGDPSIQSTDYGPAIWNPAASCNYQVGRTMNITAITIHDIEGSYAGAISWFQNCNASVSAHYVVRSSDGQITQMVAEANRAWHVGSENGYTIGIEHEGYASQTGWYTNAMYAATAGLCIDICGSGYGIDPNRVAWWPWASTTYYNVSGIPGSCAKIKGHQHFPNQTHTDPGPNWDWNYFYMLINTPPAATTYTTATGTTFDSGGSGGNYTDDERTIWTISPTGATSVTLNFTSFSVENTWDYLFIYDGADVNAPLIGEYTGTNSPGTIVSSGGDVTLEFRSDCSTTATGWAANWTSNSTTVTPANLAVTSSVCPNLGVVLNWANSGSGWFVDVSTDPNFTTFFNKDVSNLTTVNCPGGFCEYPSCASYLQFLPNTTYYWRIWDGSSETYGSSFVTPDCQYADFNCTGTFDDTGGPTNPYTGNEDYTYMIMPTNASSVTINFSSFDLETNFDSLLIYDGPNTSSPLIGGYTGTTSPGTISSTGGAMTLHFISDPLVNNAGFTSSWSCTQITTGINSSSENFSLSAFPNPFSDEVKIDYEISENANVEISLVDVLGREIILVPSSLQPRGMHEEKINFDNLDLAKGIYFLHLNVNGKNSVVKISRE